VDDLFYMWPIKKKFKKKMSNQRYILDSAELDEGGGFPKKNIFTRTESRPKIL